MTREELITGIDGTTFLGMLNTNFGKIPFGDHVFNVEDYGAIHDGVTDDTEKIQDAINACHTAGGGIVFFPAGTYIIAGALKNGIACTVGGNSYDIDFNSQLYIPPDTRASTRRMIVLSGESPNAYGLGVIGAKHQVILKSTIAGSGTFPSVIGTGKAGVTYPLNHIIIKNISVVVEPFVDDGGASMCGVNLFYSDYNVIDGLHVYVNLAESVITSVQPTSHVFGLCLGYPNGNFPIIIDYKCFGGFYYGLIMGDGVCARTVVSFWNYIGIMSAFGSQCGSVIQYANIHWNAYHIAAQQETLFGSTVAHSNLYIEHSTCENNAQYGPAWTNIVDWILDTGNNLIGYWNVHNVPANVPITKSNGGNNFLIKDKRTSNVYRWTTGTRPTIKAEGYNETTGKMEFYDGANWHDLW